MVEGVSKDGGMKGRVGFCTDEGWKGGEGVLFLAVITILQRSARALEVLGPNPI